MSIWMKTDMRNKDFVWLIFHKTFFDKVSLKNLSTELISDDYEKYQVLLSFLDVCVFLARFVVVFCICQNDNPLRKPLSEKLLLKLVFCTAK